jgi:hypothetical protein
MGRPRRKSDADHYRRHQVMHGMRIAQSTLQTAPILFMNFCLRMLSVVTTVSDFSLELERAAYGYRADYYLGGKRRQLSSLGAPKKHHPFGKVQIGGDDQRGLLMKLADQMEQQRTAAAAGKLAAHFLRDRRTPGCSMMLGGG